MVLANQRMCIQSWPVSRTPLSIKGHRSPVYSVNISGSQRAYKVITADRDGRICVWSRAMMVQPTEMVDLKRGSNRIPILCMGFPSIEHTMFVAGCDDGNLIQSRIHQSDKELQVYQAHSAPVMQVDWHPCAIDNDQDKLAEYFLSTSLDGTIKLFNLNQSSDADLQFGMLTDMWFDAKWHPNHPSMFAALRADGDIHIWDICQQKENPIVTQSQNNISATKMAWGSNGRHLFSGNCQGTVKLWELPEPIHQHRPDTHERFLALLDSLRNTSNGSEDV